MGSLQDNLRVRFDSMCNKHQSNSFVLPCEQGTVPVRRSGQGEQSEQGFFDSFYVNTESPVHICLFASFFLLFVCCFRINAYICSAYLQKQMVTSKWSVSDRRQGRLFLFLYNRVELLVSPLQLLSLYNEISTVVGEPIFKIPPNATPPFFIFIPHVIRIVHVFAFAQRRRFYETVSWRFCVHF